MRNYQNFMIFFTFLLFWFSIQFGKLVEDSIAFIMIVSVGIMHGANDLLILSKREKKKPFFLKNLIIYLCIILTCILIYLINPYLAILFFIVLSAYHFGEEHLSEKVSGHKIFNTFYFLTYGLLLFSMLFFESLKDVEEIMLELTHTSFSKSEIETTLFSSLIMLFLGTLYLLLTKKIKIDIVFRELFYLGLLFVIFKTSSLILSFAIYFIFWHSIPSIINQIQFISGTLNKESLLFYIKKAFLYWAFSICTLLILYELITEINLFSSIVFGVLFSVTAPHTWVMYNMKD